MVKPKQLKVLWSQRAKTELDDIYEYIKTDSPSAAKKVKKTIVQRAASLNDFPEKFPQEPFLAFEKENYRYAILWSYKLIFEITNSSIIIATIFHTSQSPNKIKS